MIFKDICTHTCKSTGSRDFGAREGERVEHVSGSTPLHHHYPPPRSHTICAITLRACVHLCVHTRTQVCIGRLPTFDRTIHFLHPAYYTHTGPRLNANTDPLLPPEFNQNSSTKKDQLANLRRKLSILPSIRSLYSRPRKG